MIRLLVALAVLLTVYPPAALALAIGGGLLSGGRAQWRYEKAGRPPMGWGR